MDGSQRFGGLEVWGSEVFRVGYIFNQKEVNMSTHREQGDVDAPLLSFGSDTALGAFGLDDETAGIMKMPVHLSNKIQRDFFVASSLVKTLVSDAS